MLSLCSVTKRLRQQLCVSNTMRKRCAKKKHARQCMTDYAEAKARTSKRTEANARKRLYAEKKGGEAPLSQTVISA